MLFKYGDVVFRLLDPATCPNNGSRVTSSSCPDCLTTPMYSRAGFTSFQRVRLNVTDLTIIGQSLKLSFMN